ncbi:hypothetical protein ACN42_g11729 [Penicillium freii]|uniref:Uncharacterized protein n=1 Tax=Penicillium freii TaxID=48697 RepID=A0A101M7N2_PENFR|nr:hypothetical protein ACN42_g11729 [Penicillium freii]
MLSDTDDGEAPPDLEPVSLGLAVLKLWAGLFGTNTQWPFINVLGQSLEDAAHYFVILLTLHVFYFLRGRLLYGLSFTPAIFYPCKMPTQPSKSDEPLNYSETCLLCGVCILTFDGGTISKDHLDVLKESQWEIHRKFPIPEHILVSSTEVENKSFSKYPWLSSCYQRGVNPSCQICFFLKI